MTGSEAVIQLRQDGYVAPIIGLAGAEDSREPFAEAKVDAIIDKPIESSKVQTVLQNLGINYLHS